MISAKMEKFRFFSTKPTFRKTPYSDESFTKLMKSSTSDWWLTVEGRAKLVASRLCLNQTMANSTLTSEHQRHRDSSSRKEYSNWWFIFSNQPFVLCRNIFALANYITATSMIEERVGGIWARTLVAGGSPIHFLLSHMAEGLFILLIQFIEFAFYVIFVFSSSLSANAAILMLALLLLTGLTGLFVGLLVSVIMNTTLGALTIGQFFVYPSAFISGAMWPLEGMPKFLQIIGCILPFGLPVSAFRAIYFKNSTICDPTVYLAFMVLTFWVFALIFLSVVIIMKSEKYRNKWADKNLKSCTSL